MDELELTELECDAVLLDDDAWNAKYAPSEPAPEPEAPEEPADPNEWMHSYLARLLPESMQSKEKIWNGTISALKAADVRSAEQLDAMSSDDLKMANVPMTARHMLVKNRIYPPPHMTHMHPPPHMTHMLVKNRKGAKETYNEANETSEAAALRIKIDGCGVVAPEDPSSGRSPQSGLNISASEDGRYDGAGNCQSQNPSEQSSVTSTRYTPPSLMCSLCNFQSQNPSEQSSVLSVSISTRYTPPLINVFSFRAILHVLL